jgi:hypothetical protein
MGARNEVEEAKERRVLAQIEQFLEARRPVWYPHSEVIYERTSTYASFDAMLKREILYTGYTVKELVVDLTLQPASEWKRLDFLFSYKRGAGGTALPDHSILAVLRGRGFLSRIEFFTDQDEPMEDHPLFAPRLREIAIEKAKQDGVGRVSIHNCFQGTFQYSGRTCDVAGYVEEPALYWLSILKNDETGMLSEEGEVRDWLRSILGEWLHASEPVSFTWSAHQTSDEHPDGYSLQALVELSEIGVDSSLEEVAHVFRWRDDRSTVHCKGAFLLPRQEVEEIIHAAGLKIPADAELLGISPYGEGTATPCLMARYGHAIADPEFDGSTASPTVHHNPGKIIMEGDFCVFYIDPENRRVLSEYRKWRPIPGT